MDAITCVPYILNATLTQDLNLGSCLAGLLAGWLAGWMDIWLVGWLDGWVDGWEFPFSINMSRIVQRFRAT